MNPEPLNLAFRDEALEAKAGILNPACPASCPAEALAKQETRRAKKGTSEP
jgi:hypothetical protein